MTQEQKYDIVVAKEYKIIPDLEKKVPHLSSNPYGDWHALANVLNFMVQSFPEDNYKILEVGTAHGHFIRTMFSLMEVLKPGKTLAYGIDSKLHGYCPCQFVHDKMKFLEGSTTNKNFTDSIDNDFHFIFIDACHCRGHVLKDLQTFSPKVRKGGYLALHDTAPQFQGQSAQPRTDECDSDLTIGVVAGINNFGIEKDFEFVLEEYSSVPQIYWGGVTAYRKK